MGWGGDKERTPVSLLEFSEGSAAGNRNDVLSLSILASFQNDVISPSVMLVAQILKSAGCG
eukprot:768086-Hanusia_phi.AAC.1